MISFQLQRAIISKCYCPNIFLTDIVKINFGYVASNLCGYVGIKMNTKTIQMLVSTYRVPSKKIKILKKILKLSKQLNQFRKKKIKIEWASY